MVNTRKIPRCVSTYLILFGLWVGSLCGTLITFLVNFSVALIVTLILMVTWFLVEHRYVEIIDYWLPRKKKEK